MGLTVARMDMSSKSRKQARVTLPTTANNLKPVIYSVFSSVSGFNEPLLSSLFVECILRTSFSERECCARTSFSGDSVVVIVFKFLEAVLI
jgi:hypothetical protein